MEKLGCFSWLLLVALCASPLGAIGLSDTASLVGGVILASLVCALVGGMHSRRRVAEGAEAIQIANENPRA